MNAATERSGRWQTFCAAPHRMYFFGGTLTLLLATLFWLADYSSIFFVSRPLLATNINDLYAHGVILSLGVFPLFISGFILTTFPRWMSQRPVRRAHYATAATLQTGGTLLVLVGLLAGSGWIQTGFLLTALGWLIVLWALVSVFLRASERPVHAWILLPALGAGLCLTLLLAAQPFPLQGAWPAIPKLAIWWVLLPVFLGVCHRMIPFFTKNVIPGYRMRRPVWLLWALSGMVVLRPLLPTSGWVTLGVDLSLFAGALVLWLIWMPWQKFGNRLLLILHLGFAWLWIAFLLGAANDLCRLLSLPQLLWKAPLHAMTLGFFGSLLMAMATRVSLGHSGRPLELLRLEWRLFIIIQLAAGLRVLAGLPVLNAHLALWLIAISGALWLVAFLTWALRYLPIYWQERIDHRPG